MKSLKLYSLIVIMFMLAGSSVLAVSPGEGLYDTNGNLMSEVTLFAGSGAYQFENGLKQEAAFRIPRGIALLPDGRLVVADTRNQLIRVIGEETVSVYAGFEGLPLDSYDLPVGALMDGKAEEAVFNRPKGMAVDMNGNVIIADAENHAVRQISADGSVITIAGDGVRGDADGESARFRNPTDVAVAADGTIYVADTENHVIRAISPEGIVSTLNAKSQRTVEQIEGVAWNAGDYKDGPLAEALFNEPSAVELDSEGNLYVSDTGNHLIRYIDFQEGMVTTAAGSVPAEGSIYAEQALHAAGGFADGSAEEARFFAPLGLAVTEEGGLVIADSLNHAIRYLHEGEVSTIAGSTEQEPGNRMGINGSNLLDQPSDVAIDENGRIYIADSYNQMIKQLELYQLPADIPGAATIDVVLDQELVEFDAMPEIANARTMVPVRAVGEAFDYIVDFKGEETVLLSKGGTSVELTIGSQLMITVDSEGVERTTELDVAPYIKDSRTYVPLRFFSEEFGLDVQWHGSTKTVILRAK